MEKFKIKQEKLGKFLNDIYKNSELATELGWDQEKGFLLIGSTGIGKTSSCREFFKDNGQETSSGKFGKMYYLDAFEVSMNNIENMSTNNYWLFIDDIGTEPTTVNNYGTTQAPLLELISRRANTREKIGNKGYKTFGTTNKTLDELKVTYGQRFYSRLHSLFNILIIEGNRDYRTES